MPIYEYKCTKCGESFEAMRFLSDPPLTTCKVCGEDTAEKVLSTPKIQYKEPWRPLGKRLI